MALSVGVKIPWLEQQTGVRYGTLRCHYGKWVPQEGESELLALRALRAVAFRSRRAKLDPKKEAGGVQFPKSARRCDAQRVRKGGLEPEAALEMIEVFHGECCAVWRLVA